MNAPVQITFRDMSPSPAISAHVERRAEKLETLFGRVLDCHVVVEEPHRHSRKGHKFHVRINVHVPGKELVVAKNAEDDTVDVYALLDDAFSDAERQVEDHARKQQPDMKTHERPMRGMVSKLFLDRGYGFIAADGDGHEVYFHQNSILDGRFEKLEVGSKVRFAEEDGEKGPQASTVHVAGTH